MSLNILIAEDNQYTALQYDRILSKHGHKVTITEDGEKCFKKFSEEAGKTEFNSIEKNPFDVIILDQSMPKKTGAEVADEILKMKPNQRIVFASAYALNNEKNVDQLKDRVEFLQKPFSLSKFVRTITNE